MAWLEEVKAGGGTAFTHPGMEDMLVRTSYKNDFLGFSQALNWNGFFLQQPTRGSAAFWISLTSGNRKDHAAQHGGCPILSGSKWILNKCKWNLIKEVCTMAYQKLKTNKHSFFPFFQGFTLLTSGTNILVLIREIWHRYLPIRSQPTSIEKWFVNL